MKKIYKIFILMFFKTFIFSVEERDLNSLCIAQQKFFSGLMDLKVEELKDLIRFFKYAHDYGSTNMLNKLFHLKKKRFIINYIRRRAEQSGQPLPQDFEDSYFKTEHSKLLYEMREFSPNSEFPILVKVVEKRFSLEEKTDYHEELNFLRNNSNFKIK